MAAPMVENIQKVGKKVWPEVARAMDQTTHTITELAGLSERVVDQVERYIAGHQNGFWKRRWICQETIWVMARLGYLRTEQDAELIAAAKALAPVLVDEIPDPADRTPEETLFLAAVDALPDWKNGDGER